MRHLTTKMILTCAALMLSAAGAWALPACIGDRSAWSNCHASLTGALGTYEGEWKDGKKHGQGTYVHNDGTVEEGIWKNDQLQHARKDASLSKSSLLEVGFTKLSQSQRKQIQSKLLKESLYTSVVDGIYGKETAAALTLYNKKYLNDSDLTKVENVDTLMASVLTRLPRCPDTPSDFWSDCFGTHTWATGDEYVGEWKNGKNHGKGTLTFGSSSYYLSGDKYVGQFSDGMLHGYGTYTSANGDKYIGQLKDGLFDGYAKLIYSNGDMYFGPWVNGLRQGRGDLRFKNGDRYVGDFRGGEISGIGSFYFKNGDRYHGGFRVGKFHGQGTYIYVDGTVEEGIWENGRMKQPNEAQPSEAADTKTQDNEVLEESLETTRIEAERDIEKGIVNGSFLFLTQKEAVGDAFVQYSAPKSRTLIPVQVVLQPETEGTLLSPTLLSVELEVEVGARYKVNEAATSALAAQLGIPDPMNKAVWSPGEVIVLVFEVPHINAVAKDFSVMADGLDFKLKQEYEIE